MPMQKEMDEARRIGDRLAFAIAEELEDVRKAEHAVAAGPERRRLAAKYMTGLRSAIALLGMAQAKSTLHAGRYQDASELLMDLALELERTTV